MTAYHKHWKDKDSHDFKYGALRAKNLADEIVVGWVDQTDLSGFDLQLTCHAMQFYREMIRDGSAESHYDEVARDLIVLHCDRMADEGDEVLDGESQHKKYPLCWAETMLAARALKAFSGYLQGLIDEPPAPAKAA